MKSISKVKELMREATKVYSPLLGSILYEIMKYFLGTPNEPGILELIGKEFRDYEQMEWVAPLEDLLQLIGPRSATFNQLLLHDKDPYAQITLPVHCASFRAHICPILSTPL
jgi:hypothetical protein